MPPAPPQRDENPHFVFLNLRHLRPIFLFSREIRRCSRFYLAFLCALCVSAVHFLFSRDFLLLLP